VGSNPRPMPSIAATMLRLVDSPVAVPTWLGGEPVQRQRRPTQTAAQTYGSMFLNGCLALIESRTPPLTAHHSGAPTPRDYKAAAFSFAAQYNAPGRERWAAGPHLLDHANPECFTDCGAAFDGDTRTPRHSPWRAGKR